MEMIDSASMLTLHLECDISVTEFNYTLPDDANVCHDYSFIVTATNVLGNGTKSTVQYSDTLQGKLS